MQQTVMDGRYSILEHLGSGGMARVYRAHDEALGRDVAIKVLWDQYAGDADFIERFRREARGAAALSDPNIVQVYDWGRSGDGTYYMVMEYVSGGTLKERIVREGALEPGTAVELAIRIAMALKAAHGQGMIHRDIKPQNVLITGSGDVKVADFGIARAAYLTASSKSSVVVGTASYMSPEQAAGRPVEPASDLYSLGVVLYEMLAGEPPFTAATPVAVSLKHINEAPPPLRAAAPGELEAVVMKLLAKDAGDRYRSADELIEDLRRVREGRSPAAATPGEWRTRPSRISSVPAKSSRRGPRAVALLSIALIILAAAGALAVAGGRGGSGAELASGNAVRSPATLEEHLVELEERLARLESGERGAESSPVAEAVFVHRAASGNISGNSTFLDNPLLNGNPQAIISVTPNWNPGGSGIYNNHAVGVWYDYETGRWAIFNQDRSDMPGGASFNVVVWGESSGHSG